MSAVPEYFYSVPYANFKETNYKNNLDTDQLLATPVQGLETARVLKKWRRLTQSARKRLQNAREKYAATGSSAATEEFSRVSIEVVSIPSSLYNCLEMAKATDASRRSKADAKRIFKAARIAARARYVNAIMDAQIAADQEEERRRRFEEDIDWENTVYKTAVAAANKQLEGELEDAEDAYMRAYIKAIVVCNSYIN